MSVGDGSGRAATALDRLAATLAAAGGGLSAVAIVWQGLPALIGH